MSRDLFTAGEVMVTVKGAVGGSIASLTQLGLAATPITWSPKYRRLDVPVDATGEGPVEVQNMGIEASVQLTLVHFDPAVLNVLMALAAAGASAAGTNNHAGARFGNSAARFAAGWNFFSLNLSSPVAGLPFRFYNTYLTDDPVSWPLGAERSLVTCSFRAISYTPDPWNGGQGLNGVVCWDNGQDS